MPQAVKIEEYKQIEKADVFEVRAGSYKGASELMYKEDRRIKNSSEIKVQLESKEEIYDYKILKDLDLANGDYEGIGVRYSIDFYSYFVQTQARLIYVDIMCNKLYINYKRN